MQLLSSFPSELRDELLKMEAPICNIRLISGQPCSVDTPDGESVICCTLSAEQVYETAQMLCERRLRVSPETTSQGFITLRGGHRMGLGGRVTCDGQNLTLREVTSVCIRVAHEVRGCGQAAADCVMHHTMPHSLLIAGAPGCGKTTMLRDTVRILSDHGIAIGLCDERGEIAACVQGVPQLDVGRRTHVLDGCRKAAGLRWLLRALGPQLLAMDELYGKAECRAVCEAAACGVPVIASVHAMDTRSLCRRSDIRNMLEKQVFERVLILKDQSIIANLSAQEVLNAAWSEQ